MSSSPVRSQLSLGQVFSPGSFYYGSGGSPCSYFESPRRGSGPPTPGRQASGGSGGPAHPGGPYNTPGSATVGDQPMGSFGATGSEEWRMPSGGGQTPTLQPASVGHQPTGSISATGSEERRMPSGGGQTPTLGSGPAHPGGAHNTPGYSSPGLSGARPSPAAVLAPPRVIYCGKTVYIIFKQLFF